MSVRNNDYVCTGWTPPEPGIRLMAWVQLPYQTNAWRAEIISTDGEARTATVRTLRSDLIVPFFALQSVALCDGYKVLEAYGRPPKARTPEWAKIQYAKTLADAMAEAEVE